MSAGNPASEGACRSRGWCRSYGKTRKLDGWKGLLWRGLLGDVIIVKVMHKNVFEAIHIVDVRADAHEAKSCGERL